MRLPDKKERRAARDIQIYYLSQQTNTIDHEIFSKAIGVTKAEIAAHCESMIDRGLIAEGNAPAFNLMLLEESLMSFSRYYAFHDLTVWDIDQ